MKLNKMFNKLLIFIFSAMLMISLLSICKVIADTNKIVISNIEIKEKSSGVDASIINHDNDTIEANTIFNNIDDYIIYKITLKNNDTKDYIFKDIFNNNSNTHLVYEYDKHIDEVLVKDSEKDITIKVTYNSSVDNVNDRETNIPVTFTLKFVDENGEGGSDTITINPNTGDGITRFIILGIVSFIGLVVVLIKNETMKKSLVIMVLFVPIFAKALSLNFILTLNNEIKLYDKNLVTMNIDGNETSSLLDKNIKITRPDDPIKAGYTFIGWYNGDVLYDFDSDVTGDIELVARYQIITYTISYELDGGDASNPSTYTIEDDITLEEPIKAGYTFTGWTGSNGDINQKSVSIKNSYGNKNYVANYSANTDTPYRVIHKYQNLDNTYEEFIENKTGETDSTVRPDIISRTGFSEPSLQDLVISGNGNSSLTYTYNRLPIRLTLVNESDIESAFTTQDYPYGTLISLTAKDREHYDFIKWSNNDTSSTISFELLNDTSIYPIYERKVFTISFVSNSDDTYEDIEVNSGNSLGEVISKLYTPEKYNYDFNGWYTESENGSLVGLDYVPTSNKILYAYWSESTFPYVFRQLGECIFNGTNGVISDTESCSDYAGEPYIDTHVALYSNTNIGKDYEMHFEIVTYNYKDQGFDSTQQTFMNTKNENSGYPGVVVRRYNDKFEIGSRKTSSTNETLFVSNITSISIFRISDKIYYQVNDGPISFLNNLREYNPIFNQTVWFGGAPTSNGGYQRVLTGTLKNMYVKLGTFNKDIYTVNFDGNGATASPKGYLIFKGESFNVMPSITRNNYVIDKWTINNEEVVLPYTPTSDVTIKANWKKDISQASLSSTDISINVGESENINIINNDQLESYTFSSSNNSIATVSSDGVVIGVGEGSTTIIIQGNKSNKTKIINLTVNN